MLASKFVEIDMGHRVQNHKSKCRNIHGHRYKIEVGVNDKVIDKKGSSDEGMVIDYGDLKQIILDTIDKNFDHSFMMSLDDELYPIFTVMKRDYNLKVNFVDFVPTAENIAQFFFFLLDEELIRRDIKLEFVKIWETPNSTAVYRREDENSRNI